MKKIVGIIFLFACFNGLVAQHVVEYKWSNGKTKAKGALIQRGVEDGKWEFFDKAGVLQQVVTYDFGELNGPFKNYYESGRIKEKGYFFKAKRDSSFTTYYANGNVELKGYYINGYKDSIWVFYHENGNKKRTGSYCNDQRVNEWEEWYDNGQLKQLLKYANGEEMIVSYYDKKGNQKVVDGNGIVKEIGRAHV